MLEIKTINFKYNNYMEIIMSKDNKCLEGVKSTLKEVESTLNKLKLDDIKKNALWMYNAVKSSIDFKSCQQKEDDVDIKVDNKSTVKNKI